MNRGIVVALAVGLMAGLLATGAVAVEDEYVKSKLTLENTEPNTYEGSVESRLAACEKRRYVDVFHDKNKNGIDRTDYFIGEARTNKKGDYVVTGSQAPVGDQIIARVEGRKLDSGMRCGSKVVKAIALG